MNRALLFNSIRFSLFEGDLSQEQVDGISKILAEWDARKLTDSRWLAYMLATTYHETFQKMVPISEEGSEDYLRSKPYFPWIGQGLVQVTWETNARKFGAVHPGDLLTWPVALRALFDGMIHGMFTGKKLADFFSAQHDDPVHARRIINSLDRANLIADIHGKFLKAVKVAVAVPAAA